MNLFSNHKKISEIYSKSELLSEKSPFMIAESYNSMRTNLMFLTAESKKVIAFTSALEAEGKTTIAINMGISFAEVGNKVLVIDMDMRKPRVHRYFEIPSSPGLSDRLGNFTEEINVLATDYPNLYVLPVGTIPPSPPELLASSTFDKVIAQLREEYDYIFIDTPPAHLVTDVSVISSKIDGIVFVVRENTVSVELINKSIAGLERVGAKILGFVLNDSRKDKAIYRYKYKREYRFDTRKSIKGRIATKLGFMRRK